MTSIVCPRCSAKLQAPPESSGKLLKCPKCKTTFRNSGSADILPAANVAAISNGACDNNSIVEWYQSHVRPFFAKVETKHEDFDTEAKRLIALQNRVHGELTICLLGTSGVGKSTLINALVAGKDVVLPSGGIGPLTAQALQVHYRSQPRLEVKYHGPEKLWRLTFALEQVVKRELSNKTGATKSTDLGKELPEDEKQELLEQAAGTDEHQRSRIDELKKQARLLVCGNQDAIVGMDYVVDCLRTALGKERIWETEVKHDDLERIEQIHSVLQWMQGEKDARIFQADNDTDFKKTLNEHASGFLAPLIKELRLGWNTPLLTHGIAIVDLPGVGIAQDVHQEHTARWIRERAQGVILVAESRGITEANLEMLRTTQFLNRLLFANDDPDVDPVLLMIAIVKGDIQAEDRYAQNSTKKKREHFADVRDETVHHVKNQLRHQLLRAWTSNDDPTVDAKTNVVDHLMQSLQVHVLSATQYRKFLRRDPDDSAFIGHASESGIPELQRCLITLADQRRNAHKQQYQDSCSQFLQRIRITLKSIEARWKEETRVSEEVERLRRALDQFLIALRKEFHIRQGCFREYLKTTLPEQIQRMVERASQNSRKEIAVYLRQFEDSGWKFLQAAVRRGGVFSGSKNIHLPRDIALRFEEPIAEIWGKTILKEIRKRTSQYAKDCVQLVDQVVTWAKEQQGQHDLQSLTAQRDEINANADRLVRVGREMVNELREEIRNELIHQIEKPISARCKAFVRRNLDAGTGVKRRILDLFTALAEEATESAVAPAVELLTRRTREVEEEILSVLQQHSDPLQAAADALIATHELTQKRSDAKQRDMILSDVGNLLTNGPQTCPLLDEPLSKAAPS